MSKQLTFSATLSVLAMAALAFAMSFDGAEGGSGIHAATSHGSVLSVLLQA